MDSKPQEIDWHDFNYPPLLRLFHFRISELPQQHKRVTMLLFICHFTILFASVLNLISNIIQAAMDLGKIRVLYSFLSMLMFNPVQTFVFYRGYIAFCRDYSKLKLYKIIQPIVILLWIIASIISFLSFNGYVRVAFLFQSGAGVPAILSLIQSLLLNLVVAMSSYALWQAFKYEPTEQIDRLKQALDFSPAGLITKML